MNEYKIYSMTIRQINKHFRDNDESHLWPICNRFNATERAIRRLQKTGPYSDGLQYWLALNAEISRIVNAEV